MTLRNRISEPEPVWELARLFPYQGGWSEEEYLNLETNHLIEFSEGYLEVLPMPKTSHQRIVMFLYRTLVAFVLPGQLGEVLSAPLRVRIKEKKYREPDVVFMLEKHADRIREDYWEGADLVMEIVSGGQEDRDRDLIQKRREYAKAGISEYWIVDPRQKQITVLKLSGQRYAVHGSYQPGDTATSILLKGFKVEVDDVLAAASRR